MSKAMVSACEATVLALVQHEDSADVVWAKLQVHADMEYDVEIQVSKEKAKLLYVGKVVALMLETIRGA